MQVSLWIVGLVISLVRAVPSPPVRNHVTAERQLTPGALVTRLPQVPYRDSLLVAFELPLPKVGQMASLRRLELHCTLDAPVPVLAFPATGLRWLRCGLYPLAAALALVRANADSLEELQLVAASEQPYGCPDLAAELRRCGLTKLRRMVLLRETAFGAFCRHDKASCEKQMIALCHMVLDCGRFATMTCSDCNRKLSFVDCPTSSDDDHRDKEDDLSG